MFCSFLQSSTSLLAPKKPLYSSLFRHIRPPKRSTIEWAGACRGPIFRIFPSRVFQDVAGYGHIGVDSNGNQRFSTVSNPPRLKGLLR
jgi:hypothetical protein